MKTGYSLFAVVVPVIPQEEKRIREISLKQYRAMEVSFEQVEGKGFHTDVEGKDSIVINDNSEGLNALFPTQLLALAMGSCSSADVLSILKKKRQNVTRYRCSIIYDREEDHPKILKNPVIHYQIWGEVDPDAAKRSVFLSLSKYCNVSITVKRAGINVGYKISVNGEAVDEGPAP